jgi:hypothetical protein
VEREHSALPAHCTCTLDDVADEGLMAAVDAIEDANGEGSGQAQADLG